jgi:hypothetical protein
VADLRVLRNLWTEDGARSVFASLVTHCVYHRHGSAATVRPDPGDEGLDTIVGDFGDRLLVFQAKYFCERLEEAQKRQIRESWTACKANNYFPRVAHWTLCLPIDLSAPELRWWQGWRQRQIKESGCQIDLWAKSDFDRFEAEPALKNVFDAVFRGAGSDPVEAMARIRAMVPPLCIQPLPTTEDYSEAVFVRKLEAAGIHTHRAARTAFYNFELLRNAVAQGGNAAERDALTDLLERIYDLWEELFNSHAPDELGRALYNAVNSAITREDQARLLSAGVRAQSMHKKGGLHYWADICEAGWTPDFKSTFASPVSSPLPQQPIEPV